MTATEKYSLSITLVGIIVTGVVSVMAVIYQFRSTEMASKKDTYLHWGKSVSEKETLIRNRYEKFYISVRELRESIREPDANMEKEKVEKCVTTYAALTAYADQNLTYSAEKVIYEINSLFIIYKALESVNFSAEKSEKLAKAREPLDNSIRYLEESYRNQLSEIYQMQLKIIESATGG